MLKFTYWYREDVESLGLLKSPTTMVAESGCFRMADSTKSSKIVVADLVLASGGIYIAKRFSTFISLGK